MSNLTANNSTFNNVNGDQTNTIQQFYTVNIFIDCCPFVFRFSGTVTSVRAILVKIRDEVGRNIGRYVPLHTYLLICELT
jgi:hypothetical protein